MTLEGHDCWRCGCDEGPHGCVCGNDCETPIYLDPQPWIAGNPVDGSWVRMAEEPTMPMEWAEFWPRPGYNQNREDYA